MQMLHVHASSVHIMFAYTCKTGAHTVSGTAYIVQVSYIAYTCKQCDHSGCTFCSDFNRERAPAGGASRYGVDVPQWHDADPALSYAVYERQDMRVRARCLFSMCVGVYMFV